MVQIHAVRVDATNVEQARAWDGEEGAYWAEHAESFDRAVARYDRPFLDAARIATADRVLDVGCGTGATSRAAARQASDGSVLGVDLSDRMLDVARAAADREGLRNVRFEQVDAQIHPFDEGAFDVAVSRTGAMFFGDAPAAFGNLARALRPGGRLVLLVWQPLPRNEWVQAFFTALAAGRDLPAPPPDAPSPFSLGDPDRVRRLLTGAGFAEPEIEGLEEPMYFGADADDAHGFIAGLLGWMLEGLDVHGRARALDALRDTMEEHETGDGVLYRSATWLVTTQRVR
jgi:SAM-dependent methyltransferase